MNLSDEEQTQGVFKKSGERYIVEKILDKKIENNEVYYLLKYHDYADKYNTWENVSKLQSLKEQIIEFEKNYKQNQKELSPSPHKKVKLENNIELSDAKLKTPEQQHKSKNFLTQQNNGSQDIKKNQFQSGEQQYESSQKKDKEDQQQGTINGSESLRGSFEGGDKAKEIVHAKVDYNGVLCLVIWKTRLNGFLPQPTLIYSKDIKKYQPQILVEFYESRIKIQQIVQNNESHA